MSLNPFALKGPEFLVFYAALGASVLVFSLFMCMLARGLGRPLTSEITERLDAYEIAYLRGGPRGAIEAATAALLHRGRLTLENGTLFVPENAQPERELVADGVYRGISAPRSDHPLEAAILATFQTAAPITNLDRATIRSVAESIGNDLAGAELIVPPGLPLHLRNAIITLPAAGLLLLGLVRLGIGIANGRPVLYLAALLLCSLPLLAIRVKPGPTYAGAKALKQLKEQNDALQYTACYGPQQLTDREMALATALFGAAAIGGTIGLIPVFWSVDAATSALAWNTSSFRSCGGFGAGASCGSSCASACGGGSCGGGCGGCGGCG